MFTEEELTKFQKEALDAHNECRYKHIRTPNLKLSEDLNKIAQAYAEELAKTDTVSHSRKQGLGENIAMYFGSVHFNGGQITRQWYDEIKNYDFDSTRFQPNTGYFSQVVWAGTTEMGIGKAVSGSGKVMIVANYQPQGNILRQFQDNVLPLK